MKTIFQSVVEYISGLKAIIGVIFFVVIVIILTYFVFIFTKKTHQITKNTINYFEDNGKYIAGIFVELNNSKECLRYFVNGRKWLERIIKSFNNIYKNYYGNILKKSLVNNNLKFKLFNLKSTDKVRQELIKQRSFFDSIEQYDESQFKPDYKESIWLIRGSRYSYISLIDDLLDYCKFMTQRFVIMIGSAGNGKTNIVCSLSELIIRMKNPCILINSRDINTNVSEFFWKKLKTIDIIIKHKKIVMCVINILLFLQKKKLFIIIDAINENDNDVFSNSICDFIDDILSFSQAKVLVTCRSEYFETRFKKLFNNKTTIKPQIFNIKDTSYNEKAIQKIYQIYKEHFNFSGTIHDRALHRLINSLILMRMFFEVYHNSTQNIVTLNKYKIYKEYIQEVRKRTGIDIEIYLHKIVDVMLETKDFNDVSFDKLQLNLHEISELKLVSDENVLLSRVIKKHEGTIAEKNIEVAYFVFDELRDYCIAKQLISFDMDSRDQNYGRLFETIDYLYEQKMSTLEGILRYAYSHFKSEDNIHFCMKILTDYNDNDIPVFWGKRPWLRETDFSFHNFGLSLIFDSECPLHVDEKNYIFKVLSNSAITDIPNVFWFLIKNQRDSIQPDFDLFIHFLCTIKNYKTLKKVLSQLQYRSGDYYEEDKYRYKFEISRMLSYFKKHGGIPDSIFYFIIVFYSVFPNEDFLKEFLDVPQRVNQAVKKLCGIFKLIELKNNIIHVSELIKIQLGR